MMKRAHDEDGGVIIGVQEYSGDDDRQGAKPLYFMPHSSTSASEACTILALTSCYYRSQGWLISFAFRWEVNEVAEY